jgi:hypothetical protein
MTGREGGGCGGDCAKEPAVTISRKAIAQLRNRMPDMVHSVRAAFVSGMSAVGSGQIDAHRWTTDARPREVLTNTPIMILPD